MHRSQRRLSGVRVRFRARAVPARALLVRARSRQAFTPPRRARSARGAALDRRCTPTRIVASARNDRRARRARRHDRASIARALAPPPAASRTAGAPSAARARARLRATRRGRACVVGALRRSRWRVLPFTGIRAA
ncbi:MAG: hypothetical protein WDW36_001840 [Sanguina aurantia]